MAFSPDFRTLGARSAAPSAVFDAGLRGYMLRVYNWMASGLLLTGVVAFGVANSGIMNLFYQQGADGRIHQTPLALVAMFAPMAFVLVLSFGVNKLSRTAAQALYWLFCVAMGLSLTSIFMLYTGTSITRTFFVAAGTFAAMSAWGYTTRADLTRLQNFLYMGVFGLILASLANLLFHSTALQFLVSVVGVLVFTGLAASDTQRIKATYLQYSYADGPDMAAKRSVYDALSLYLKFINLFLFLMQLMGNRRSN